MKIEKTTFCLRLAALCSFISFLIVGWFWVLYGLQPFELALAFVNDVPAEVSGVLVFVSIGVGFMIPVPFLCARLCWVLCKELYRKPFGPDQGE